MHGQLHRLPSLASQCRTVVRQRLLATGGHRSLYERVPRLPLPPRLQRFLLFDVEEPQQQLVPCYMKSVTNFSPFKLHPRGTANGQRLVCPIFLSTLFTFQSGEIVRSCPAVCRSIIVILQEKTLAIKFHRISVNTIIFLSPSLVSLYRLGIHLAVKPYHVDDPSFLHTIIRPFVISFMAGRLCRGIFDNQLVSIAFNQNFSNRVTSQKPRLILPSTWFMTCV